MFNILCYYIPGYTRLLMIIRAHQSNTIIPTAIIMVLRGSFPAKRAAIGAASVPPIMSPKTIYQLLTPTDKKKVKALAKVIKNSVRLTEPTVYLGLLPLAMRLLVTIGPQPPPPKESKKPPAPASHPTLFTFLFPF